MLRNDADSEPSHIIADIAFGTGASSLAYSWKMEIQSSPWNRIPEMREMGMHQLDRFERLVAIAGTAEETTLRSASVDFVTAAQAAHWFDLPRARAEIPPILRPEGWCVLIWNERRIWPVSFCGTTKSFC